MFSNKVDCRAARTLRFAFALLLLAGCRCSHSQKKGTRRGKEFPSPFVDVWDWHMITTYAFQNVLNVLVSNEKQWGPNILDLSLSGNGYTNRYNNVLDANTCYRFSIQNYLCLSKNQIICPKYIHFISKYRFYFFYFIYTYQKIKYIDFTA